MNIRYAMRAVIKKDLRGVAANRNMLLSILIVPLIMTVVLPSIFVFVIHMAPEDPDMMKLLDLLPADARSGSLEQTLTGLILNYIMPIFFLVIPIMAASVTAASAFAGEKEKHTLETLLCCPLSLKQIFCAKVLASFFLSMAVCLFSFCCMMLVLETEVFFLLGSLLLPGPGWIFVLLLISPSVSLIAVTLIIRGSAKARSVEESQQGAVFLIIPVLLLIAGQFSGLLLLNVWLLAALGVVCALLAWLLLKIALRGFTSERLLKAS